MAYIVLPPTIIRFLIAGAVNTAVFYLSFIFLIYLGINYLIASTGGYVLATLVSYILNKVWTFKSQEPSTLKTFIQFVIINLLSLSGNLFILYIFVDFFLVNLYFSQLIALFFSLAINYFGYKRLFTR